MATNAEKCRRRYWANPEKARAEKKKWHQENREKVLPKLAAYRESHKAERKAWLEANADRLREYRRERYARTRDQQLEHHKLKRKADPVAARERDHVSHHKNKKNRNAQSREYKKLKVALDRSYWKKLYARNRETLKRKARERSARNPEKMVAVRRKHYLKTKLIAPEKLLARSRARGHRVREATEGSVAKIESFLRWLIAADVVRCHWCGVKIPKEKGARHADHVIPLARGGKHALHNLAPSCAKCNCSKHDLMPHEWLERRRAA